MKPLLWTIYRRLRLSWASITEKNEFLSAGETLGLQQEWQAVQNLLQARADVIELIQTDPEGYLLYQTPLGPFWAPPGSSDYYIRMLLQEIKSNIYRIDANIPADSVFLDCGANIGFFTRFALLNGAPRVVAFEPAPKTAICLRRNLEKEIAAGRVVVVEKGLWDSDVMLAFSTSSVANPGSNHVVENGSGDMQLPLTTIDTVCQELGIERLAYIKMDIEGAEVRALKGARKSIEAHLPHCLIATEHTEDLFQNALDVLEIMRLISPRYRFSVTEWHHSDSPAHGRKLTPYCLSFRV
jgi:FkbM family methyltransferase